MRLEEGQESFHCLYCTSVYFPEKNNEGVRVLGEPAELFCPVCSIALVHAALAGCRILYCTNCRGMLVRMGLFIELIQTLQANLEGPSTIAKPIVEQDLKRHLVCPQCHQAMDTHPYAGPGNIVIDSCSRCYLNWLDAGELMRIASAPDRTYQETIPEL
jgi:Zn-finger nucleic acid-binding protein